MSLSISRYKIYNKTWIMSLITLIHWVSTSCETLSFDGVVKIITNIILRCNYILSYCILTIHKELFQHKTSHLFCTMYIIILIMTLLTCFLNLLSITWITAYIQQSWAIWFGNYTCLQLLCKQLLVYKIMTCSCISTNNKLLFELLLVFNFFSVNKTPEFLLGV